MPTAPSNVIIADDQNKRIRLYDARKATLTSILGGGVEQPNRGLLRPHGVCVHEDGFDLCGTLFSN